MDEKELELLRKVITTLDNITVPVWLTEQVAVPICRASGALKNMHDRITAPPAEQPKEEDPEEAEA